MLHNHLSRRTYRLPRHGQERRAETWNLSQLASLRRSFDQSLDYGIRTFYCWQGIQWARIVAYIHTADNGEFDEAAIAAEILK